MESHHNHITKLFFWAWYLNSAKLTSQSHLHKEALLKDKLKQHLFFFKVKLEVYPSYNFWWLIETFVNDFDAEIVPFLLKRFEDAFLSEAESILKKLVYEYTIYWRVFPQILRDFWYFYPKYDVKFDNVECIYIDIWCDLPKAIDSLLSELLVRDAPLREKLLAKWPERPGRSFWDSDVLPPVSRDLFSEEELSSHLVEFLSGEDSSSAEIFLEVISFYLNSRPNVKSECAVALASKGIEITDKSLMTYFLGEYIFKGVSNECKRFFVANTDLSVKNPLREARERQLSIWNNFSEEERQVVITLAQNGLQYMTKRLEFLNSLTLEEKAEYRRKLEEEAEDDE